MEDITSIIYINAEIKKSLKISISKLFQILKEKVPELQTPDWSKIDFTMDQDGLKLNWTEHKNLSIDDKNHVDLNHLFKIP